MINQYPIYIVDDEEDVRASLLFLLESYNLTAQTFDGGKHFLASVDISQPGCVILDSRMPGLTGQQVHKMLIDRGSPLAVIFLTGHGDVPMAVDALKEGAVDFFQKPVDGQQLISALEKAIKWSKNKQTEVIYGNRVKQLTPREREMFSLIAKGYKNKQISDELCISMRTVEVHRSNLMKQLKVKTMAELILIYASLSGTLNR